MSIVVEISLNVVMAASDEAGAQEWQRMLNAWITEHRAIIRDSNVSYSRTSDPSDPMEWVRYYLPNSDHNPASYAIVNSTDTIQTVDIPVQRFVTSPKIETAWTNTSTAGYRSAELVELLEKEKLLLASIRMEAKEKEFQQAVNEALDRYEDEEEDYNYEP